MKRGARRSGFSLALRDRGARQHLNSKVSHKMKTLSWLALGAVGFGIMCFGYFDRERPAPGAPWAEGAILIGPPPAAGEALPGGATPVLLRLL
jgi:hypothetical protein